MRELSEKKWADGVKIALILIIVGQSIVLTSFLSKAQYTRGVAVGQTSIISAYCPVPQALEPVNPHQLRGAYGGQP